MKNTPRSFWTRDRLTCLLSCGNWRGKNIREDFIPNTRARLITTANGTVFRESMQRWAAADSAGGFITWGTPGRCCRRRCHGGKAGKGFSQFFPLPYEKNLGGRGPFLWGYIFKPTHPN